jgi:hypothetical protein
MKAVLTAYVRVDATRYLSTPNNVTCHLSFLFSSAKFADA